MNDASQPIIEKVPAANEEVPSDAARAAELPPLRIHHLMLWTAVTAVMMAITKSYDSPSAVVDSATIVGWVAASAVALVVTIFGCVWRRRGLPFFNQPGHGIAVLIVLGVLRWSISTAMDSFIPILVDARLLLFYVLPSLLCSLLAIPFIIWIWRRLADTKIWKWYFFLWLLGALLEPGGILVLGFELTSIGTTIWLGITLLKISFWIRAPEMLVLLVALAVDRRRQTPRHWTHWAAVLAYIGVGLSELVQHVHHYFFSDGANL